MHSSSASQHGEGDRKDLHSSWSSWAPPPITDPRGRGEREGGQESGSTEEDRKRREQEGEGVGGGGEGEWREAAARPLKPCRALGTACRGPESLGKGPSLNPVKENPRRQWVLQSTVRVQHPPHSFPHIFRVCSLISEKIEQKILPLGNKKAINLVPKVSCHDLKSAGDYL